MTPDRFGEWACMIGLVILFGVVVVMVVVMAAMALYEMWPSKRKDRL